MKKRIIFVAEALWIGGIEVSLINLLNALDYQKYDVTCLVTRDDCPLAYRLPAECRFLTVDREHCVSFGRKYRFSRLAHLTEPAVNPSHFHRFLQWTVPVIKWLENCLYIRYIRSNLKTERFDTAVIYSDRVAELTIRAIRANQYVMFFHHGAIKREYHDEIGYRRSKNIIAVSEQVANMLRKHFPKYKQKIMTLHNVIDIEWVKQKSLAPIPDYFDPELFHIATVSRIAYDKGIDLAVSACAELLKRGITKFCWWIVGSGPELGKIKELIRQGNLESHIQLVGMKDNPYPYIRHAELYVQPSRVEAFGLTIREAKVLGKCVLSTETLGAREILNPQTDHLCEANPSSIAEQLQAIITVGHTGSSESGMIEIAQDNRNTVFALEQLL